VDGAGDGPRFGTTYVGLNSAPRPGRIAAVGFYGDAIQVGHGSAGGWDVFGPKRRITRSKGNVLYELDGEPALDLYKRYLGEDAKGLPGSALLFPLKVFPSANPDEATARSSCAAISIGWSRALLMPLTRPQRICRATGSPSSSAASGASCF